MKEQIAKIIQDGVCSGDSSWDEITINVLKFMREPTPDMRIKGGIAWSEAMKSAETYVDCSDACYKAMIDAILLGDECKKK